MVRVALRKAASPKNLRIADRKSAALNAACGWCLLAACTLSAGLGFCYASIEVSVHTPDMMPEAPLMFAGAMMVLLGLRFAKNVYAAWKRLSLFDEKLRRRNELLAGVLTPARQSRKLDWLH